MKRIVDGKRFSKRTRVEIAPEDLPAVAKQHGTLNGKGSYTVGGWWASVQEGVVAAVAYLESARLPSTPVLFKSHRSGEWQAEPPEKEDFGGIRSLEHHFKQLKYSRDSLEDLASRIICSADRLEKVPPEKSYEIVMAYTEARTLARVYGLESSTASNNARYSRKKAWAIELAEELVGGEYGNFPEAWRSLRKRARGDSVLGEYGGQDVELILDHDELIAEDGTKIKRESFRTGPFKEVKDKEVNTQKT